MKLLALRELRRQAPAAAGMFGLGVLTLLLMFASTLVFDVQRQAGYLEAVFLIVAVGTPWLLSVTAVAPDQETGAESFLVTMPIGRARLALMRTGVALGLSLLVIGITGAMCLVAKPLFQNHFMGELTPNRSLEMSIVGLAAGGLMFTAGALATVLVRQTLVAFVISPGLLLGPGLLYVWGSSELVGVPDKVSIPVLAVSLPLLLLVAAWKGYLRPTRELGWRRPTRFVVGLTTALFVVGAGLTTTAFAVDRLIPSHRPHGSVSAPNGAAAAVTIVHQDRFRWSYRHREEGHVVVLRSGSVDQPLELPSGLFPLAFSPRARSLLLGRSDSTDLTLLDLKTGTRTTHARPRTKALVWGRTTRSLSTQGLTVIAGTGGAVVPLMWHDGTPWLADDQGLVRWDGAEQRAAPAGAHVVSATGRRALFQDARGGVHVLDLGAEAPMRLGAPDGTRALEWQLLGLEGRWVVTLVRATDGSCSVWVRDLEGSTAWRKVKLAFPDSAVFGVGAMRVQRRLITAPLVHFVASPTAPFASLSVTVATLPHGTQQTLPIRTVDLRSGETRVVTGSPTRNARRTWLPDGRLLTRAGIWDPAQGHLTKSPEGLERFAKGYRDLLLFEGRDVVTWVSRIDLKTGEERAFLGLQRQ